MPPPSARCARHAEVPAVDVCQRCGSFVCGECVNIRKEDVYCAACAVILERPGSRRPLLGLLAALLAPLPLLAGSIASEVLRSSLGQLPTFAGLLGSVLVWVLAMSLLLYERAHGEAGARRSLYRVAWAAVWADLALAGGSGGLLVWLGQHS